MNIFTPNVAYASLDTFLASVNEEIINPLIVFLFALAILYFIYGVFEFLTNQENEDKKTSGRNHMFWGIIGITIMMGVWTLLNIVLATFDIKGIDPENNKIELPKYNP